MIPLEKKKCPRCGHLNYIIPSNNPLIHESICIDCLQNALDMSNLNNFGLFCRTFNYPCKPEVYMDMYNKDKENYIKNYIESLYEVEDHYQDAMMDKWSTAAKEWEQVKTHRQLLEKINPLRQDFTNRCGEKWGREYNLEQYLRLESQFNTIVKQLSLTNPTQVEMVKKYCKMSILVDDMIAGGEVKQINDATTALGKLADLAQIKELSETASEGTIKTVADLYKYMEDHGFRFQYYDHVDRDIVDSTMKDIQGSITTTINNAVGLDVTLQQIKDNFYNEQEQLEENKAEEETPIAEIMAAEDSFTQEEEDLEKDLSLQELFIDDDE